MAIIKMKMVKLTANKDHFEEIIKTIKDVEYFHGELASDVINSTNNGSLVEKDKFYLQARQFFQTIAPVFKLEDNEKFDGSTYPKEEITQEMDKVSKYYKDISEQIAKYTRLSQDDLTAINQLRQYNIDVLNGLEFCNIFFGRIPHKSYKLLENSDLRSMIYDILHTCKNYDYLLCVSSSKDIQETRDLLQGLLFEPIEIPAIDDQQIIAEYHQELQSMYNFLIDRGEVLDRYQYIVNFDGTYTMTGFVESQHLDDLKHLFSDNKNVKVKGYTDFLNEGIIPPTELKNGWLSKPFEMLLGMYGTPNYLDFDPSGLLAITYCLLFGIMFGDIGQGFVFFIGGFIVNKIKKNNMAEIISRLGIFSMVFGFVYGSIFGMEDVMLPFYEMFGMSGPPIHVMDPAMTMPLLIGACSLGGFLIVISICINIYLNIKRKDTTDIWFSPNGVAGLVFYFGIIVLIILSMIFGLDVMKPAFIIPIIVIPLICMMFKQPLDNLVHGRPLLQAKLAYEYKGSDYNFKDSFGDLKKEDLIALEKLNNFDFDYFNELGYCHHFLVRVDNSTVKRFEALRSDSFVIEVLNSNSQFNWAICFSKDDEYMENVGSLRSLFIEPMDLPHFNESFSPSTFIKQLNDFLLNEDPVERVSVKPQLAKSWGGYIVENFFELFETVLSFVTNTMSFLRVAGFILSHAGMMLVVMTLRDMSGDAGWIVLIAGNVFVMGLEGLIVGIQTLRLEYYEMFSRYFIAGGKSFIPFSTVGNK